MPAWNHQVQGFGQEVLTSYTESVYGGHSFYEIISESAINFFGNNGLILTILTDIGS